MDLLFDMMTGVGLAAIAALLLFFYIALSREPRERRRGRHVAGPAPWAQPWKSSGSTSSRNRLNSSTLASSVRGSASSAGIPASSSTRSAT